MRQRHTCTFAEPPWSIWRSPRGTPTSSTCTSGKQQVSVTHHTQLCNLATLQRLKSTVAGCSPDSNLILDGPQQWCGVPRMPRRVACSAIHQNRPPAVDMACGPRDAASAMLFWELYSGVMPSARLAMTLHNMDSSGECSQENFAFTGRQLLHPESAATSSDLCCLWQNSGIIRLFKMPTCKWRLVEDSSTKSLPKYNGCGDDCERVGCRSCWRQLCNDRSSSG